MAEPLFTAGLIVIKEQQLLLAYSNNKMAWYLPGGKIDVNETATEALVREIKEELHIDLDPERLEYFCHITAPAYGEAEDMIMEQSCYWYDLTEAIQPSAEIGKVAYFNRQTYLQETVQVAGVMQVFEKLAADNIVMGEDHPIDFHNMADNSNN